MTPRQRAILAAVAEHPGQHPRRLNVLAGLGNTGRGDVGARNTLNALSRRGLVKPEYTVWHDRWTITQEGRAALAEGAA